MKLNKIFAITLAAVALTGCTEDPDLFLGGVNTENGVTVAMGNSTFATEESEEFCYVPITVTGNTNGKVEVTVEVTTATPGQGEENATEGTHFAITSKTINIAEGENTGFLEIHNLWETGVINNDRVYNITITKAKGATIGDPATCTVTIANSDSPYTMLLGNWKFTGVNMFDGKDVEVTLKMVAPSSSSEYYGSELYLTGIFGRTEMYIPFTDFDFDVESGTGTMELGYGSFMSDYLWTVNDQDCVLVLMGLNGTTPTLNAQATCTFNEDMNEIVVPETAKVVGGWYTYPAFQYLGMNSAGVYRNIKITRVE